MLLFIFQFDIYSFIAFPFISIVRAIILLKAVTSLNLFRYGFDFDKLFLFSKGSGILGFFETLTSNTKSHLFRFLLGIVLSDLNLHKLQFYLHLQI